jgi:hypothetical protein
MMHASADACHSDAWVDVPLLGVGGLGNEKAACGAAFWVFMCC